MASFAQLLALTAVPVVGSIINTLISGKKSNPVNNKRYKLKKKQKPYVKKPTAYPVNRSKAAKSSARYSHPWPDPVRHKLGGHFERLL